MVRRLPLRRRVFRPKRNRRLLRPLHLQLLPYSVKRRLRPVKPKDYGRPLTDKLDGVPNRQQKAPPLLKRPVERLRKAGRRLQKPDVGIDGGYPLRRLLPPLCRLLPPHRPQPHGARLRNGVRRRHPVVGRLPLGQLGNDGPLVPQTRQRVKAQVGGHLQLRTLPQHVVPLQKRPVRLCPLLPKRQLVPPMKQPKLRRQFVKVVNKVTHLVPCRRRLKLQPMPYSVAGRRNKRLLPKLFPLHPKLQPALLPLQHPNVQPCRQLDNLVHKKLLNVKRVARHPRLLRLRQQLSPARQAVPLPNLQHDVRHLLRQTFAKQPHVNV